MRNGTFCIHRMDKRAKCKKHRSEEIPPWKGSPWPGTLFTKIEFGGLPDRDGFECGLVVHRTAKECPGTNARWTWHGNTINKIIEETCYPVYYKKRKNLLIARCDEDSVCNALRNLCCENKKQIDQCRVGLDLLAIVNAITYSKKPDAEIRRIWIRNPQRPNVRTRAEYGRDLTGGGRINRLKVGDEIISLAVRWPIKQLVVDALISDRGVITFISRHNLAECLGFIEYLVMKYPGAPQGTLRLPPKP